MNRYDLLTLCDQFATQRRQLHFGRLTVDLVGPVRDPVPEIIRSFREAEISESEKNALLSLVCEDDDEVTFCDEAVCITDPYADELASVDDDA